MKTKTATVHSEQSLYSDKAPKHPRLNELKGTFAIEGIHVSEEQLRDHAAAFARAVASGEADSRILRVLAKKR